MLRSGVIARLVSIKMARVILFTDQIDAMPGRKGQKIVFHAKDVATLRETLVYFAFATARTRTAIPFNCLTADTQANRNVKRLGSSLGCVVLVKIRQVRRHGVAWMNHYAPAER
jgi:hypothetical protein